MIINARYGDDESATAVSEDGQRERETLAYQVARGVAGCHRRAQPVGCRAAPPPRPPCLGLPAAGPACCLWPGRPGRAVPLRATAERCRRAGGRTDKLINWTAVLLALSIESAGAWSRELA